MPVNYLRGILSTQTKMTLAELAAKYPASGARAADGRQGNAAQPTPAFLKLQTLMGSIHLKNEKATEASWVVRFTGNHAKSLPVYVKEYQGLALVEGIVVTNPSLTAEQMQELLKRNFNTDLVRASIAADRS